MELTFDLKHVHEAAEKFWHFAGDRRIFAFDGGIGAGKTTFIHALCDVKKVKNRVGSPTFAIINEYNYDKGKIFHIDLYRLSDEEEAVRAGVEECLYSGEICLVEWAEKTPRLFPDGTMKVLMEILNKQARKLTTN
jgi:tRNA threonylcarbamoyladenosine biosynthesis protein TsaE